MRYLLLLTALCFLAACNANTDPIPPAPTASVVASTSVPFTPTAEVVDATTIPATEVPSTETSPTEVASTDVTPLCEVPVDSAFQERWEANGADATCPSRNAEVGDGAYQPFTNGLMIWTSVSDEEPAFIYVINNDGTWQRFEDLFQEGDTESAELVPPAGQLEPIRGFGLIWREELGGSDATIGWALQDEAAQEVVVQEFGNDSAITTNNQLYWLLADGTWQ
jgi:hypothetical protein